MSYYVATNGRDSWSGSQPDPNAAVTDGPFASLARAQEAVRQMKREAGGFLLQPVKVLVRGGRYYLDQTLVIGPDDAGTRDCPVQYTAFPNEKPILSGGRVIAGWTTHRDRIVRCDVPWTKGTKRKVRQLFLDGTRQVRARYPNADPNTPWHHGWIPVKGPAEKDSFVAFKYDPAALPRRWAKPTQAEVFMIISWGYTTLSPIAKTDPEHGAITMADAVKNFARQPWGPTFATHFGYGIGYVDQPDTYRFYVENLLEELDQPGEWCADTDEGKIYFWPPTGAIERQTVVIPVLDCLIRLHDTAWITIDGFTFTETANAGDNMHRPGYEGTGAMFPIEDHEYCGEALHLKNAHHCRIVGNLFASVGGNAVYLEDYNSANVIQANEIANAGHCGIVLLGKRSDPATLHLPTANEVTDNHIYRCGEFDKAATGVFCGVSTMNVIGHNLIEHVPHHAINLGNSGYGRNIVEYNRIRHSCQESGDNAAINCWMEDERVVPDAVRSGHVFRHNVISDTPGRCTFGIYLDNFSSNCTVYGNVIVRSGLSGIRVNGGRNNLIENNIIVGPGLGIGFWNPAVLWTNMKGFMSANRFCRNIVYRPIAGPKRVIDIDDRPEDVPRVVARSDCNLFFDAAGTGFEFTIPNKTLSLADWRRMGHDEHSFVADPMFVDPQQDDYRLKPESPAFKLGFQPIDPTAAGPRTCRNSP